MSSTITRILPVLALAACGPHAKPMAPGQGAATTQPAGADSAVTTAGQQQPSTSEPEPEPPPEPTGSLIRVTVLGAEIEGLMPNGEQWDANKPVGEKAEPQLEKYVQQHPELLRTADSIGTPIDAPEVPKEAAGSPAADPMILVEVGDRVFRSPVKPRAFNPAWEFSFELLVGSLNGHVGLEPEALVRIHVVDSDGSLRFDTIGTTVVPLATLLAQPLHKLDGFGSVKSLTLRVDRIEDRSEEPQVHRFAVTGAPPWTDTGIELVAGQRVLIEAADEICLQGKVQDNCTGPEGLKRLSTYSLPGFAWASHGALVGALGDTRFLVQRRLEFTAASSGRLRLGVNDRKWINNQGSWAVRVTVQPYP